ncbi:4-hydroxybenzoate polyprenyltransferase [Mesorhizobium loti]|jgi:4-hydroxybenzoate polyprenyltransferase|uniref:4-hydroxybenzoate polyprenyltransferase n=2 Tax=Mesorhizobium TaxID=68287 RepID=A0A8E2WC86_RHILI|nr:UbiA family prenyltransferase [Mesorhizobium loti]PWJ91312.1 4-hydroxybenzoate polyprenyltransferase [Mesorhizobium loti]
MYADGCEPAAAISPPRASLKEYLAIARFDHATKHVFILPGVIVAYALREPPLDHAAGAIAVGFLSAVAIASANYVLNEWLDREFDAFHPTKRTRSAVLSSLSPHLVYLQYFLFASVGLLLATTVGTSFFYTSVIFLISGLTYNVKPLRSKDLPYLDVISESVNNPIRLTLGWTMIDHAALPPSSLLLGYWAAGAFLMGAKRLSEYRDITSSGNVDLLQRYRRSFRFYTAENLTVSCFLYAMMAAFFIAVFLTKYRLEYILALPFLAILFASYLWLSLLKNSIAQRPERMFRSRRLMASLILAVMAIFILSFVDLPWLYDLSAPSFKPVDMQ